MKEAFADRSSLVSSLNVDLSELFSLSKGGIQMEGMDKAATGCTVLSKRSEQF